MRQQRAKREWLAAARKLRSSGVTRGTYFMSPTKAMSAGDAPAARKARMACSGTEAAKQRSDAWDLFHVPDKSHERGRCASSAQSANGLKRHGSCEAAE
jgi:hypothetical protein